MTLLFKRKAVVLALAAVLVASLVFAARQWRLSLSDPADLNRQYLPMAHQNGPLRGISRLHPKIPKPDTDEVERTLKQILHQAEAAKNASHNSTDVGSGFRNSTEPIREDAALACVVPEVDFRKLKSVGSFSPCATTKRVATLGEVLPGGAIRLFCEPGEKASINGVPVDHSLWFSGVQIESNADLAELRCGSRFDMLATCPISTSAVAASRRAIDKQAPPLNIIYISVDSLSRAQFHRQLVASSELLRATAEDEDKGMKNFDVYNFRGMNVNGDGTLKTMIPLLTGWDDEDFAHLGHSGFRGTTNMRLDDWPWIFSELNDRGYVTAWTMDSCLDIFTLSLVGFDKVPWQHPSKSLVCGPRTECGTSSKYSHEHVFDHMRAMLHSYNPLGVPVFTITHLMDGHGGNLANIAKIDVGLPSMLRWLDSNYGNTSIVVIGGDHGPRYGNYRQTLDGKLEERLPMLAYLMPKWFKVTFPKLANNLRANEHKLVTPYDLHQTVRHAMILMDTIDDSHSVTLKPHIAKLESTDNGGQSIFLEIPSNRTCESAGLPLHWCSCMEWVDVTKEEPPSAIMAYENAVINFLNNKTGNGQSACQRWSRMPSGGTVSIVKQQLGEKMRTYDIKASESARWKAKTKLPKYSILIQTKLLPAEAVFEGILDIENLSDGNRSITAVAGVNRLSRHDFMSEPCRGEHAFKQKYCACKSWQPSLDDLKEISFAERFKNATK